MMEELKGRRSIRKLGARSSATAALVGILLLALVLGSCGGGDVRRDSPEGGKPSDLQHIALYSGSSPFNRQIPPDPEIDPDSDTMIESILADAEEQGFMIGQKKWTVAAYYAGPDTPRHDVRITADWAAVERLNGVPIPDFAAPDPEDDGEMAIIDLATGCEYDFWQARREGDGWTASWANAIKIDGDGVFPQGMSAKGSGFALLAGMIWPDDLERGRIDHALVFSYSFPKSGGPVAPATESDGFDDGETAIPEGARLQLDPTLDLDSLELLPCERAVAQALQEYGMILGDAGGGVELEAVHPMSVLGNPYEGILPEEDYVYLPNIPIERLRVLKLPPQVPDADIEIVPNDCAEFE